MSLFRDLSELQQFADAGQADRGLVDHAGEVVRLWTVCPWADVLTPYDLEHIYLFNRLLDAELEGADAFDMARHVFSIDPCRQPDRAYDVVRSHLERAHWLLENELPYLNW